jgi:hypothetical protein
VGTGFNLHPLPYFAGTGFNLHPHPHFAGTGFNLSSDFCATPLSTSIPGRSASRRPRLLDERRQDPAEEDSRENEQADRDRERDAEREAG